MFKGFPVAHKQSVTRKRKVEKMIKDDRGNNLEVGDLVLTQLAAGGYPARVIKVDTGKIITSGFRAQKAQVRPSLVIVQLEIALAVDPQFGRTQGLFKIVDPKPEEPEEEKPKIELAN
jgi:hypothetical protein